MDHSLIDLAIDEIREVIGEDESYTVNHLIDFMYQIIISKLEEVYAVKLGDVIEIVINLMCSSLYLDEQELRQKYGEELTEEEIREILTVITQVG